jgi:hypothetical protein
MIGNWLVRCPVTKSTSTVCCSQARRYTEPSRRQPFVGVTVALSQPYPPR